MNSVWEGCFGRIEGWAATAAVPLLLAVVAALAGCGKGEAEPEPTPDVFVAEAPDDAEAPKAEAVIRAILKDLDPDGDYAALNVDYPLEGSVFPPDMVAPTFLWHDAVDGANVWLVDIALGRSGRHVYAVTRGKRPKREIDPVCVTETNALGESEYQVSAKAWTPDEQVWGIVKRHSVEKDASVAIYGLTGDPGARRVVSRGGVSIRTSRGPVGAPVFYRDVPLMPAETLNGIVKPLPDGALPLVKWRLRDLSKPEAPVVMTHMPTCANCHSFSRDGRTLAMDMDGPQGDKGAHFVKAVAPRMRIDEGDVFSWNRFRGGRKDRVSFGMFPRISPDGRYVVATVHESIYVQNYKQYEFLQTFYPTRGILAVYERRTGDIRSLPGAADPDYVQTNAVWSPDGRRLVFARAKARDAYPGGPQAKYANDPNETQIRYDLYHIPFNAGRGGKPEPVEGASNNGMSNSFPKFSPDGRWIVYVQAKNGLLMRPDSTLHIIPAGGGKPRRMRCNTDRMNSWHSWSPNGRWLVFSSKANTPYTQMFLTHVDKEGRDTPAILIPNSTAFNRAVNLPEFANIAQGELEEITTPAVDYRRRLDRGEELEREGQLDEAEAELRKSLALKADYADTWYALGIVFAGRKDYAGAVKHYRKAIDLEPRHHRSWNNLGVVMNRLGRPEEALRCFTRSLEIHPGYDSAHTNMGNAFFRRGLYEKAMEHYRQALEADPRSHKAHNNLGAALREQGKLADAVREFRKAIEIDPAYHTAYRNLGDVLVLLGRREEAAAVRRKAEELKPDADKK